MEFWCRNIARNFNWTEKMKWIRIITTAGLTAAYSFPAGNNSSPTKNIVLITSTTNMNLIPWWMSSRWLTKHLEEIENSKVLYLPAGGDIRVLQWRRVKQNQAQIPNLRDSSGHLSRLPWSHLLRVYFSRETSQPSWKDASLSRTVSFHRIHVVVNSSVCHGS